MAFDGFLRQGTAVDVLLGVFVDETDGFTAETGLTVARSDVLLSKNGQGLTQKTDVTAAAHDTGGSHNCELDVTDTNTVGHLTIIVHVSGARPLRLDYQVIEKVVYDEMFKTSATGTRGTFEGGRYTFTS